jgi:hypothetical protein
MLAKVGLCDDASQGRVAEMLGQEWRDHWKPCWAPFSPVRVFMSEVGGCRDGRAGVARPLETLLGSVFLIRVFMS